MSLSFSPAAEKKFDVIVSNYPRMDAALLPVLWLAQEEFGYLSEEARDYVAQKLDVSRARVDSVVSFYTMYNTEKKGKFHLQVCRSISCYLRGSEKIFKSIELELGIKPGETSTDGIFTYSQVECLGACGNAPAMQVNVEKYHENLSETSIRQIIGDLKNGKNSK